MMSCSGMRGSFRSKRTVLDLGGIRSAWNKGLGLMGRGDLGDTHSEERAIDATGMNYILLRGLTCAMAGWSRSRL